MKKVILIFLIFLALLGFKTAQAELILDETVWQSCLKVAENYNKETNEIKCPIQIKIDNSKTKNYVEFVGFEINMTGVTLKKINVFDGWYEKEKTDKEDNSFKITFVTSNDTRNNPVIYYEDGTYKIAELVFTYPKNDPNAKIEINKAGTGYFDHQCQNINNVYFNDKGSIVNEEEYLSSCNIEIIKCKEVSGIFYDNEGNAVSEDAYKKSCLTEKEEEPEKETSKIICSEKDGKYYDKNGNEVSKEAYYTSCGVVENPKTGNFLPIIIFGILSIIVTIIYLVAKQDKIYKI